MDPLKSYLQQCGVAISSQAVRALLVLDHPAANAAAARLQQIGRAAAGRMQVHNLDDSWHALLLEHLDAVAARQQGSPQEAYSIYTVCRSGSPTFGLLDLIKQNAEAVWLEGVEEQTFTNAEQLAREADATDDNSRLLDSYGEFVTQAVSYLGLPKTIRPAQQHGYIRLLLIKCKVLLRLNQIMQVVGMLKTLNPLLNTLDWTKLPASMTTTMMYYIGLANMYNEDLTPAAQALRQAYRTCDQTCEDHKCVILRALIPVMLLQGYLPADELLQGRGMQGYQPIKVAVQAGDVGLLTRSLEQQRLQFIQQGTYLLMEKLLLLCYRRLLQRVLAYHAEAADKPNFLPLELLLGTLQQQGVDTDMEALQCTVGTLIARNYVKGYLSYTHKVLVVAKDKQFPDDAEQWYSEPFA